MICRTRRPRTARIRMFASRTIMSTGGALSAPAKALEVGYQLFFVNLGQGCCKTICRGSQFGEIGFLCALAARRDVDAQSLASPGDGYGDIRFEETGDLFAELAYANFDCGHVYWPRSEC